MTYKKCRNFEKMYYDEFWDFENSPYNYLNFLFDFMSAFNKLPWFYRRQALRDLHEIMHEVGVKGMKENG